MVGSARDHTTTLQTTRLTLRMWRSDEAARLLDIRCRPDVARWLGDPTPWSHLSTAVAKIAEWRELTLETGPLGVWAIDAGHEAGPHGSVRLGLLPGSQDIEIGWYLHPDSQGQGYAAEAAGALLAHALLPQPQGPQIKEVWAIMWPDNHGSAKVARSIGMTDRGVIKDPWYGTEADPDSRVFVAR